MSISGALRRVVGLSSARHLLSRSIPLSAGSSSSLLPKAAASDNGLQPKFFFEAFRSSWAAVGRFSTSTAGTPYVGLTDTRFPQRRPGMKSRKKRASLKPPGPYAWVQYVPGEPIPRSRPNEGSVQGRKRKKRIMQRKAFILAEKKKRKAQYAEARKRKENERIERKIAAVARQKAWEERLKELQLRENEKKAAMA